MIETSVVSMMLNKGKAFTDHIYLLKDRNLYKRKVDIPVPTDRYGDEKITIIDNKDKHIINGTYKFIPPEKMRFYYKTYGFSMENTIIAFNDMKLLEPRPLTTMAFDIEVGTTGSFPDPNVNKIISIGYAINNNKPEAIYLNNASEKDNKLIIKFIDILIKEKIDVITGYYSSGFDIPYIYNRAMALNMDNEILRVCGESAFLREIADQAMTVGKALRSEFGYVLHHDIFDEVMADQSLYKLKHRTLKAVGRHFLGDDVDIRELEQEELSNMIQTYTAHKNKIIEYQLSDAFITQKLTTDVYTNRVVAQANELGIPLNVMFRRSKTLILQIELMRRMRQDNIFLAMNNRKRYSDLYERNKTWNKKKNKYEVKGKPYQGAWTQAFQTGKHNDVHKYDYAGMYTSIIMSLNLSHETTELISIKDGLDKDSKRVDCIIYKEEPDHRVFRIHDENQKATIDVKVDMRTIGFIPKILIEFKQKRKDVKEMMESVGKDDPLYTQLDSKQQMYKVMGNSIYGLLSNKDMPGWLPAGMVTTAIGRHIAGILIDILKEGIGPDCILELDTDGVLVSGSMDLDVLNKKIIDHVEKHFMIPRESIQILVEEDEFDKIFIHKSKNYILQEKDGNIIIHGSALKSSKMPKVMDRFINLVIEYAIKETISKDELRSQALDIDKLSLDYFKTNVKMSKSPDEYTSLTPIIRAARELSEHTVKIDGKIRKLVDIKRGSRMEYVMLKDELSNESIPKAIQLLTPNMEIDYDYYRSMINNMLTEMGIVEATEDGMFLDLME